MAHPLSGADIGTLARVLRDGGGADRRLRGLGIRASVLTRLPFSTLECIAVGRRLPKLAEMAPPVFILGHWRSGTTHLYNVMALGGFGYVAPLAVGLPWDMFGLGGFRKNVFRGDAETIAMVSGALGRWAGKWGCQAPAPVESAP